MLSFIGHSSIVRDTAQKKNPRRMVWVL